MATTNTTLLRLSQFVDHFTLLARHILSCSEIMSVSKIDELTDKLIGLWDTMPEALQFNEGWTQPSFQLPEWPLEVMSATLFAKVQSFLILLNRQRNDRSHSEGSPYNGSSAYHDPYLHRAPVRGRTLVINSSFHLLQTFMFFYHRNKAVLICWTMGQQAFNAAMILILDAWETDNDQNMWIVHQAYAVFVELHAKGVHKLAKLAMDRIFAGLQQLRHRSDERAISRRPSNQAYQQQATQMSPDTASMADFMGDTVMGGTGMFLLEDSGLQSCPPQYPTFRPLAWNLTTGSAHPSNSSNPPTPDIPSPIIPVSQITASPFPVMSTAPVTQSPFAIGLQPRMAPAISSHRGFSAGQSWYPTGEDADMNMRATFTAINTNLPPHHTQQSQHQHRMPQGHETSQGDQHQHQQQQSFSQVRGLRHSHAHPTGSQSSQSGGTGARPRTTHHRLDKPPRSQQRRK
ncbi:hypothetical protein LTR37_006417 [Vermiconidia calcicola]|uniref:Uncharacterized protein n=1 Tax=Vermiconidia calcicola TaxID=1690605 RepID=A0ACC3NGC9_9PEZI|nr:hypothetical protein LTR37_006417 [Vermiconidia calcicola]